MSDFDIVLKTRIDRSNSAIEQLNKDIAFLDKRVGKKVKESLNLNVRLDKTDKVVNNLKKDVTTLQNKLKTSRIELGVKLNKDSLDKLRDQIKNLNLEVSVNPKVSKDTGKQTETKSSVPSLNTSNISREMDSLKKAGRTKFTIDMETGNITKQIDTINKSLLETHRIIQSFNEDGSLNSIVGEKDINKLKAENELYREQKKLINEIDSIDRKTVKASSTDEINELNKQREIKEEDLALNREKIQLNNLHNKDREDEINKLQELHHLEQNIIDIKDRERNNSKMQNEMYKEQRDLQKEVFSIENEMSKTDSEKQLNVLSKRKEMTENELQDVKQKIELNNLSSNELEKELVTMKELHKSKMDVANIKQTETDNVRLQKELYSDQLRLQKEIFAIDKRMSKTDDDAELDRLKEFKKIREEEINMAKQAIGMNHVQDPSKEWELERLKEIHKIELDIVRIKDSDKKSNQIYNELNKAVREEFQIKQRMVGVDEDLKSSMHRRLMMTKELQDGLKGQLKDNGLYNKERENELLRERDRLMMGLIEKEEKLDKKEELRVQKLGERLEAPELESMNFDDGEGLKNYVQQMYGAQAEITNFAQKIDAAGNRMWQFDVVTESSANKLKTHKLAVDENTASMYKMGESVKPNVHRMMSLVEQMGEAIKKSAIWAVSMGMLYGSLRKLKEGIEVVKELDKDLTQVAIGTGQAREEVQKYAQEWVDLGIEMGKTVDEISKVNVALVRQGLSMEESQQRLSTILQLSAVANMDTEETLRIITSSVNALGTTSEIAGDVLVNAGQITASSVEEIGDALTRVASSAQSTGVSIEQLGAVISVLTEVTQESPQSLGNSLKTLVARFNKINEVTGETNEEFNEVQKAFESVGVTFLDSTGQIRPFYELLEDLSGTWDTLDKNTKSYVGTMAAGKMSAPLYSNI